MKKISLLSLLALLFTSAYAQDTLFMKSGKIRPVLIIGIDTIGGNIIATQGSDTLQIAFTSLKSYVQHTAAGTVHQTVTPSNPGATYDYRENYFIDSSLSRFGIGINLTSPVTSKRMAGATYSNITLMLIPQYRLTPKLVLGFPIRIGDPKVPDNSIGQYYLYRNWLLIVEAGISPIFEVSKHKRTNLYLKPGISFGEARGWISRSYKTYLYTSPSGGNYYDYSYSYDKGPPSGTIRVEAEFGLNWKLSKFIHFQIESGFKYYRGPAFVTEDYSNSPSDPSMNLTHRYSDRFGRLGINGALDLVFFFPQKKSQ